MAPSPRQGADGLRARGIVPDKQHGQHFLVDERVLDRQLAFAAVGTEDVVLEVGPGPGNLTRRLAARARQLFAVEIDEQFRPILTQLQVEFPQLTVLWGDATLLPLPRFDKVVANLPYRVALPLLFRFLEHEFTQGLLLVQLELAQRVGARPGLPGYGAVSVALQTLGEWQVLETVPPEAFWPRPQVVSAFLQVRKLACNLTPVQFRQFRRMLDWLFLGRLRRAEDGLKQFVPRTQAGRVLGLLPRAVRDTQIQALTPAEFGQIAEALRKCQVALPEVPKAAKMTAQQAPLTRAETLRRAARTGSHRTQQG